MAQIATTTHASPIQYPGSTKIDYNVVDGGLYVAIRATTADTIEIHRSLNGGASWGLFSSLVRTLVQEVGPIFIDPAGWLGLTYRTLESGADRIYYRRMDPVGNWSPEVLCDQFTHGGAAGLVFNGMDLITINTLGSVPTQKTLVAVGTNSGGNLAVSLYGIMSLTGFNPSLNNSIINGPRQLAGNAGTGHVGPSLDLEHVGNGKGANDPSVWLAFGRNKIYTSRLAWNGSGWLNQPTATPISGTITAIDQLSARFDGTRFLIAQPSGSTVVVWERHKSNTTTVSRTTGAHPAGTVRQAAVTYDAINGNIRVYAVGTTDNDLRYVDFVRQTATWGAWSVVTTTDILGAAVDNWSIRRGSTFTNKFDVMTAHSGTPNTIVHTQLPTVYSPTAPLWQFDQVPYVNGSAADVAAALLVDWSFEDPDENDAQSAYALARFLGTDQPMYWQASNGTWQTGEIKNTSGTSQVTLPTGLLVERFDAGVAAAWTNTSCTLVASVAQSHSTGTSALMTTTGTPAQAFTRYVEVPVAGSTSYAAELWGLSVAGYGDFGISIDWFTSGHVYISTSTSGGSALAAGVWGRRSVTATSPSNAAFAQVGPTVGANPPTSTAVYIDDVTFGLTPTPWAAATDRPHTYKVKTWDLTDLPSPYSDGLIIVPSAKVNPTITSPTEGQTVTGQTTTLTWTVAEQTAYQVRLFIFGVPISDSGKQLSTATEYVVGPLANAFSYSIILNTWNAEGLKSADIQVNIAVAYVNPNLPTLTAAPLPLKGLIRVAIANPGASAFVAAGTAATGDNVTLNPAQPAGLAADDLVVVLSAIENSGTGTPNQPAGYGTAATFGNMGLFTKTAAASEGAPSCSFAGGAAGAATSAQTAAWRRAGTTLLQTPVTQLNGSAQNIAYPGFTPAVDNAIVILAVWKQNGAATDLSTPAGMTKVGQSFNATGQTIGWYRVEQSAKAAISSGTITVTGGASAISRVAWVALSGIPSVLTNDLYRRVVGATDSGTPVAAGLAPNAVFDDKTALARTQYEYLAQAVGANGIVRPSAWTQ